MHHDQVRQHSFRSVTRGARRRGEESHKAVEDVCVQFIVKAGREEAGNLAGGTISTALQGLQHLPSFSRCSLPHVGGDV